jgi:mycothiol synthase
VGMEAGRLMLPSGLVARRASMGDVDAVTALVAACELHDDGAVEIDRDDVETDLSTPGLDLDRDTIIVHDGPSLVAFAAIDAGSFGGGLAYVDVHPLHRGLGIGSALLAWTEARALEAGCRIVNQTKTDANREAAELLRRRGYRPRWTSWILEMRLEREPAEPILPDGVRVRDFVPGRDDHEVYRLVEDAFNEWERRRPQSFERWASFTVERETFVPSRSPVALAGDEVVGALLSLDYGDSDHVHQLAVRRSHRNRGIATALLQSAFRQYHRAGRRVCTLSTDSRTGALALYQRVGMRIRRSYTNHAKELRPAGDAAGPGQKG